MAQAPPMGTGQSQPDGKTVSQVAMVLASGAPVATMIAILIGLLGAFGVTAAVVTAVVMIVLQRRLPTPGAPGPAMLATLNSEAAFRAAYLVNAGVRVQNAVGAGSSLGDALTQENKYFDLHQAAQLNRRNAAESADKVAVGGIAGWKATLDSKTSPECAAADGKNFRLTDPPSIGFPGAVHPHCRCRPVRPYLRAGWVEDALSPALVGAH